MAHKIAAVGSRSVASAQKFLDTIAASDIAPFNWGPAHGVLDGAKAHGSYEDVYNDPVGTRTSLPRLSMQNVDAVYIGTPHVYHHANAKAALLAGKNVLCEKPFTLDVAELDELIAIAKEKNLFLMEWVITQWTMLTRQSRLDALPPHRVRGAGRPQIGQARQAGAHDRGLLHEL